MKKRGIRFLVASGLVLVGFSTFSNYASAYSSDYHNEYRVWSPNDRTLSEQKWTESAYLMNCTEITGSMTNFSAHAIGNRSDTSDGHSYNVKKGSDIELYNLTVERYGKGVSAWIACQEWGNGAAYGSWQADK